MEDRGRSARSVLRDLLDVDDGTLDLSTKLDLDLGGKSPKVALGELALTLASLHVHKRGEKRELFGFDALTIENASLDLGKQSLVIGAVTSRQAKPA